MKILYSSVIQTPTKPMHPAWIRTLCQYDVTRRFMLSRGYEAQNYYHVDDTSLQVAKLITYEQNLELPKSHIGEFLGLKYIEANKAITNDMACTTKILLESQKTPPEFLAVNIREIRAQLELLNIELGPTYYESSDLDVMSELFNFISSKKCLLDQERYLGNIFLDLTDHGKKLITLKGKNGYTYIAKFLAFLYRNAKSVDQVIVQMIDEDIDLKPYLDWFLTAYDVSHLFHLSGRIKINGSKASSRNGGAEDYTFSKIYEHFSTENSSDLRVGLRIYYLGTYDDMSKFNFDYDELQKSIRLAKKIRLFLEKEDPQESLYDKSDPAIEYEYKKIYGDDNMLKPSTLVKLYVERYFYYKNNLTQLTLNQRYFYADALNFLKEILGG